MNRAQRPPLQHPLAPLFDRAIDSFSVSLSPDTTRHYRGTARNFLSYLGADHPEVQLLDQLRREPHILGWMSRLRSQVPPLVTASLSNLLFALRGIFHELAWAEQLPELAHLIRREDLPRLPQRLPRPLTREQDELLQQEFLRRNDLGGNAFLLIRHTGMRIGECADLSCDCLRATGTDQWAIHVPLGKLKTERMVPVDSFVCELVRRLRFFRSLDPLPDDGRLLARPGTQQALVRQLRDYLHQVCHALGLPTGIVPHQLRHTYASEMLRAGVSFPVLMKILGHTSPEMTMRYLDVVLTNPDHACIHVPRDALLVAEKEEPEESRRYTKQYNYEQFGRKLFVPESGEECKAHQSESQGRSPVLPIEDALGIFKFEFVHLALHVESLCKV